MRNDRVKIGHPSGIPVIKYESDRKDLAIVVLFAVIATLVFSLIVLSCAPRVATAGEVWKVTAYCACQKCCGPEAKGVTASGKRVKTGMVACNWLPFGTKVEIEGLGTFEVADRGAKSLFGDKAHHIKHLDVYMPTHREALNFGVKWLSVEVR